MIYDIKKGKDSNLMFIFSEKFAKWKKILHFVENFILRNNTKLILIEP